MAHYVSVTQTVSVIVLLSDWHRGQTDALTLCQGLTERKVVSKTDQALQGIKIAGYHGDQKTFIRLYVEHRISIRRARVAYASGEVAKATRVRCNCHECSGKVVASCAEENIETF